MNREQKRKAAKEEMRELKTSKLKAAPKKLLVGCVGAGDEGCSESVLVAYSDFRAEERLFASLQEIGWFLAVTEVVTEEDADEEEEHRRIAAEDDVLRQPGDVVEYHAAPSEIAHSILCPICAEKVLTAPPPEGLEDIIEPGSTRNLAEGEG